MPDTAPTGPDDRPDDALWSRALDGDSDAFEEAVAPYQELLLRDARRKVNRSRRSGALERDDLTPEELVGETLLRAHRHRARFQNQKLSFRGWLLGLQYRMLQLLTRQEQRYHRQKAVSLDENLPPDERTNAVEEEFYEFNLPYDYETYGDIVPGSQPDDVIIYAGDEDRKRLTEDEIRYLDEADLDPSTRTVIEFHDEFELTLPEIAQIMDSSLKDAAEAVEQARVNLRQRIGSTDADDIRRDRRTDSYTGDTLPDA